MKKQLTLKLIESNDKPQVGDIFIYTEDNKIYQFETWEDIAQAELSTCIILKSILISDEEFSLKDGDNYAIIGMSPEGVFNVLPKGGLRIELYNKNIFKIEVTSEQIPTNILEAIVEGKLKDNSIIEVEYYNVMLQSNGLRTDGKVFDEISLNPESNTLCVPKLDSNNKAIVSIPEETAKEVSKIMYSEEEVEFMIREYCSFINQKYNHSKPVVADLTNWFEDNKKK